MSDAFAPKFEQITVPKENWDRLLEENERLADRLQERMTALEDLAAENERLRDVLFRNSVVKGLEARLSAAEASLQHREVTARTWARAAQDLQARLSAAEEENERLKDEAEGWHGQGPLARQVDELRNENERLKDFHDGGRAEYGGT